MGHGMGKRDERSEREEIYMDMEISDGNGNIRRGKRARDSRAKEGMASK